MSRQGLCSVGESGRRVMVFSLFLGTVPRGEGPAIEIAPGWPLAAKSAYADWDVTGPSASLPLQAPEVGPITSPA